jgi:peptidoglycan-associated lipoprotein
MNLKTVQFSVIALLAFSLTGCPPKKQVKTEEPKLEDQQQAKPSEEPSLRGKDYKEVAEIQTVYFDLDQSSLRSDARDTLGKNYQAIKEHADWEVLVEGHCDERGTTEYNLGLGQKRAAAVRQYYMSLGLSGTKVATISYGKESPACTDHTEDCWSKNRRGVTKVRATEAKP